MTAITVPQIEYAAPIPRPALHEVLAPDPGLKATREVNRWMLLLSVPFVLASIFFMATLATGDEWLIGGALATGPGLLIVAFIYLALSSETNGVAT